MHTLAVPFLPSSHFRWPKVMSVVPNLHQILAVGCQVFGRNATSIRSLSGEVPCCSVFDVGLGRAEPINPSMSALPCVRQQQRSQRRSLFFHSSTSALPSIRQNFLDSHFQPALHTEPARLWRGGGVSTRIRTSGGPKCLKKVMLYDMEWVIVRSLDSMLRSSSTGRV